MKIFLVDKNPPVRELLEEFFKKSSHEVFQFSCAEHAIDAIKKLSPDFIISGARLGVIDGMDFLKICRSEIGYCGYFLIMTSYPAYFPEEYLKNGANYYFDKNTGYSEIFSALDKILSEKAANSN